MINVKNNIFAFLGSSGSGKDSLAIMLEEEFGVTRLISHTTRIPRKGENNKSYFFVDVDTFNTFDFIEEVEYAGNKYGLSKAEIDDKLKSNDVYTIVNREGVEALKSLYGDQVKCIYIYADMATTRERMIARGDSKEAIEIRLNNAIVDREFENFDIADKVIYNNKDLSSARQSLREFITPTIFVDIDETLFKSIERFVSIYNKMNETDVDYRKVYDYDFAPAIKDLDISKKIAIFNSSMFYKDIECYEGALFAIRRLALSYNIKFLTMGTHENIKYKMKELEWLFPDAEVINLTNVDKSIINYGFRDFIIDDVEDILITSGCPNKILFAPNGEKDYNKSFRGVKCDSWMNIYELLRIPKEEN